MENKRDTGGKRLIVVSSVTYALKSRDIHYRKNIVCDYTLRNHGICIHIVHCKTLHCLLIPVSGGCNKMISVFRQFTFRFYCFFILLHRKKNFSFPGQSGKG